MTDRSDKAPAEGPASVTPDENSELRTEPADGPAPMKPEERSEPDTEPTEGSASPEADESDNVDDELDEGPVLLALDDDDDDEELDERPVLLTLDEQEEDDEELDDEELDEGPVLLTLDERGDSGEAAADGAARTKPTKPTKCGYVAIVGPPNVGKSTLMNALVGERLSIVTPKPHTTRTRVLGIITDPNRQVQVIFLDTPGMVLEPKYRLQVAMTQHIDRSLEDADVVLAIFDCERPDPAAVERTVNLVTAVGKPVVYVLNKIDTLMDGEPDMSAYPEGTIPISGLKELNLPALGDAISAALPIGPYLYPEDTLADQPERFFVAELIRETIFEKMRKEIPYTTAVIIEEYVERQPKDFVRATILVDRDSQKGIVIGKGGAMLKTIGRISREKIETFLERGVYMELFVKVKKDWMKKDIDLRELGYMER